MIMSILDTLRKSVSGASRALKQPVSGRMQFVTLSVFLYGVLGVVLFALFFFIYFSLTLQENQSVLDLFVDPQLFYFTYYYSFASQIFVLFLVHAIWQQGGGNAQRLNFGRSIKEFPMKGFLVFTSSFMIVMAISVFLSENTIFAFENVMNAQNPMSGALSINEDWRLHLLESAGLLVVRFAPSIVVGYYLVSLKEGNWKVDYLVKYWKSIVGIGIVWTAAALLFNYVWEIINFSLLNFIGIPFTEPYIPVFLSLVVFVFLSIHYYKIVGYLVYFSIFDWDGNKAAAPIENSEDLELLDQ